MKRIDSVNARPNINGTGKTGFHDNADLSGQDATYLTPEWLNVIQEELCNLLELNGVALNANVRDQLYQLLAQYGDIEALAVAVQQSIDNEATIRANADSGLQQQINNLADRIYLIEHKIIEDIAVGDVFITLNRFKNGAAVAAHKGYGKWKRVADGQALVGRAISFENHSPNHDFLSILGGSGGEHEHQLTISEMPAHRHQLGDAVGTSGAGRTPDLNDSPPSLNDTDSIGLSGGDQPHNNVQPSFTVDVWQRMENYWSEPAAYMHFATDQNADNVVQFLAENTDYYIVFCGDNIPDGTDVQLWLTGSMGGGNLVTVNNNTAYWQINTGDSTAGIHGVGVKAEVQGLSIENGTPFTIALEIAF